MDVDAAETTGQPLVSRSKTSPFLVRTFVKIGGFHRLTLFEDGSFPTTDEHQLFAWRDATLREVLTTLRNTSPHIVEFKHPLARFSFRTVYADSTNKGRFAAKDLGMVYSRDILGEPGALNVIAPRFLAANDHDGDNEQPADADSTLSAAATVSTDETKAHTQPPGIFAQRERQERTLEELRFVPGDFLCISVILPKGATAAAAAAVAATPTTATSALAHAFSSELNIKGANVPPSHSGPGGGGWKSGAGVGAGAHPSRGAGSGHWRGGSDGPTAHGSRGGGRGGRAGAFGERDRDRERERDTTRDRGDRDRDRDRERDRGDTRDRERDRDRDRDRDGPTDRRVPPPRRYDLSPPPRNAGGWGARGGGGPRGGAGRGAGGRARGDDRRSRSRSRSRSPPPHRRRGGRYD